MSKSPVLVRKEMAEAIIHRVTTSGLKGKVAEKAARHMLLGASNLALVIGDSDMAHELRNDFTDVVEHGLKKVYSWAGIAMPAEEIKEAA